MIVAAKIIGGAGLDAREGDFDGVLTGTDFCTGMPAAGACSRCFLLGLWSLSPYEGSVSINGTSLGASARSSASPQASANFSGVPNPFACGPIASGNEEYQTCAAIVITCILP